jgi:hypothetical protein
MTLLRRSHWFLNELLFRRGIGRGARRRGNPTENTRANSFTGSSSVRAACPGLLKNMASR